MFQRMMTVRLTSSLSWCWRCGNGCPISSTSPCDQTRTTRPKWRSTLASSGAHVQREWCSTGPELLPFLCDRLHYTWTMKGRFLATQLRGDWSGRRMTLSQSRDKWSVWANAGLLDLHFTWWFYSVIAGTILSSKSNSRKFLSLPIPPVTWTNLIL